MVVIMLKDQYDEDDEDDDNLHLIMLREHPSGAWSRICRLPLTIIITSLVLIPLDGDHHQIIFDSPQRLSSSIYC